jgi:hypothetical protein
MVRIQKKQATPVARKSTASKLSTASKTSTAQKTAANKKVTTQSTTHSGAETMAAQNAAFIKSPNHSTKVASALDAKTGKVDQTKIDKSSPAAIKATRDEVVKQQAANIFTGKTAKTAAELTKNKEALQTALKSDNPKERDAAKAALTMARAQEDNAKFKHENIGKIIGKNADEVKAMGDTEALHAVTEKVKKGELTLDKLHADDNDSIYAEADIKNDAIASVDKATKFNKDLDSADFGDALSDKGLELTGEDHVGPVTAEAEEAEEAAQAEKELIDIDEKEHPLGGKDIDETEDAAAEALKKKEDELNAKAEELKAKEDELKKAQEEGKSSDEIAELKKQLEELKAAMQQQPPAGGAPPEGGGGAPPAGGGDKPPAAGGAPPAGGGAPPAGGANAANGANAAGGAMSAADADKMLESIMKMSPEELAKLSPEELKAILNMIGQKLNGLSKGGGAAAAGAAAGQIEQLKQLHGKVMEALLSKIQDPAEKEKVKQEFSGKLDQALKGSLPEVKADSPEAKADQAALKGLSEKIAKPGAGTTGQPGGGAPSVAGMPPSNPAPASGPVPNLAPAAQTLSNNALNAVLPTQLTTFS